MRGNKITRHERAAIGVARVAFRENDCPRGRGRVKLGASLGTSRGGLDVYALNGGNGARFAAPTAEAWPAPILG